MWGYENKKYNFLSFVKCSADHVNNVVCRLNMLLLLVDLSYVLNTLVIILILDPRETHPCPIWSKIMYFDQTLPSCPLQFYRIYI